MASRRGGLFGRFRRAAEPAGAVDPEVVLDHGTATSAGPRSDNQDRAASAATWAVLSDGMGGHAGGDVAAEVVVDAARASFEAAAGRHDVALLEAIVRQANTTVRERRAVDPRVASMGATVTLAAATDVAPDRSSWLVGSLGDSPAWVVANGSPARQVTNDHSLAGELARSGAITDDEAAHHPGRHVLMRAVGTDPDAEADIAEVQLAPGDTLVLASDGLSDVADRVNIAGVVSTAPSAAEAAQALVDAALSAGTADNVTVIVLRYR